MCVVEDIQLSRLNKRARRRRTITRSAQRSGSGPLLDTAHRGPGRRRLGRSSDAAPYRYSVSTEVRDGGDSAEASDAAPERYSVSTEVQEDGDDLATASDAAPYRYSVSTEDRDGGDSATTRRPGYSVSTTASDAARYRYSVSTAVASDAAPDRYSCPGPLLGEHQGPAGPRRWRQLGRHPTPPRPAPRSVTRSSRGPDREDGGDSAVASDAAPSRLLGRPPARTTFLTPKTAQVHLDPTRQLPK